ncbi:MAG TPA: hypothetical protein VJ725_07905 [Thermoanaerobaculia bacterium]|nr:hypothetical protein [Thermoanaerobaculia bacterium]
MRKLIRPDGADAEFKDVPDDLVRSVRAPTLVVLGDQDIVKPEDSRDPELTARLVEELLDFR